MRNNFSNNTRISRAKNDGKKLSGKSVKTRFFYKLTNIVFKKWAEINARKNFSKNSRIGCPKIVGKKRLEKVRKHVFYKHTNIVTRKWGEKYARNFFSRKTRNRELKTMEKIVWKKCGNTFFINTRLS